MNEKTFRFFSLTVFMLLSLCFQTTPAQKKQNSGTVVNKESQLFRTLVPSTAKVMFIDSIVVDKDNFLKHIPLSKEAGRVFEERGKMFYENELKTQRIFSEGDTVKGYHLQATNFFNDNWSKPKILSELGKDTKNAQYPFMMSDGITLIFSAEGNKSVGGRDLFLTRYNPETNTYYRPDNYGLPFNSTANDYFLAIDDLNSFGWLVTDRFQPEGKVCIYTFIPSPTRIGFEDDPIEEGQLSGFAKLRSIKDTWAFGDIKKEKARYQAFLNRKNGSKKEFSFVINDEKTYHSPDDFRSSETRGMFLQWRNANQQLKENEAALEKMRRNYSPATSDRNAILNAEKTIQKQRIEMKNFEKQIRNKENQLLPKH